MSANVPSTITAIAQPGTSLWWPDATCAQEAD